MLIQEHNKFRIDNNFICLHIFYKRKAFESVTNERMNCL